MLIWSHRARYLIGDCLNLIVVRDGVCSDLLALHSLVCLACKDDETKLAGSARKSDGINRHTNCVEVGARAKSRTRESRVGLNVCAQHRRGDRPEPACPKQATTLSHGC